MCNFKLLVASNKKPEKTNQVDFKDFKHYSTEFECLSYMGDSCEGIYKSQIISLGEASEKYKKIHPESPYFSSDADSLSLLGTNYIISNLAKVDFTHSGRQEALVILEIYYNEGNLKDNQLVLFYFDKEKNIIRPERVDQTNLYKVKSRTHNPIE